MKKRFLALLLSLCLLLTGCVEIVIYGDPFQFTVPGLTVHFLDVGQADCTLLEYGGEFLLIDGGNREDGRLVVAYLEQMGVRRLNAVICTHPHEDHVGGLASVLAVYPADGVYAPTRTYASSYYDDFLRYADQQRLEVLIPAPGDTIPFGDVTVTVLGPLRSYAQTNDTSLVVKAEYGQTSFLFTGDMEKEAERDLLEHWGEALKADVLKVGHHGSDTSSGYRFIRQVDPDYGVISVGKDNSYGHPHREPLERCSQAGVTLLRTDDLGHIVAWSDGLDITFYWQNQSARPDAPRGDGSQDYYIGNRNSRTFHTPFCDSLPAEKNRVVYETYEEAVAAGCSPCRGCLE